MGINFSLIEVQILIRFLYHTDDDDVLECLSPAGLALPKGPQRQVPSRVRVQGLVRIPDLCWPGLPSALRPGLRLLGACWDTE